MKKYLLYFIACLFISSPLQAADDPMASLFKFHYKVARQGNVKSIMKLGEMYENGTGTRQDLDKALEMFKKAQALGHADAAKAIKRVEKKKALGPRLQEIERRKKAAAEAAKRKAEQERLRREKEAKAKAARDKARKAAEAKRKAEQERLRRQRELAAKKAAKENARKAAEAAKRKAEQERLRKQREQLAKQKSAQHKKSVKPAEKAKSDEESSHGFVADPCETPAGRFMSSCKKRGK